MRNGMALTNEALQQLVEHISLTVFHRPFLHRATWNNRLQTTGGRYLLQTHNIELNPKVASVLGEDVLIGVIKHELCHYHLHLEKRGYKHRDVDFKQLLKSVNGLRFIQWHNEHNYLYYDCQTCHTVYRRKRRINTKKYVCSNCFGTLKIRLNSEKQVSVQ